MVRRYARSDRQGIAYALGREDRRWTEDERAWKEEALRKVVADFDASTLGAVP
jgi:hypothetical protein